MRRSKRTFARKSRLRSTENSGKDEDTKECTDDHCSELDNKTLKIVIRNPVAYREDIEDLKRDKSCELVEKKLQTIKSEVSTGCSDIKEYKENGNDKSDTENFGKGSSECTETELCARDQRCKRDKKNLKVALGKVSVEHTGVKECIGDQMSELDKGNLRIVVRKNSETGEWIASEHQYRNIDSSSTMLTRSCSTKKTVCTCAHKEQTMYASDNVRKNMKTVVRCTEIKQKGTETKSDNSSKRIKTAVQEFDTAEEQENDNTNFKEKKFNCNLQIQEPVSRVKLRSKRGQKRKLSNAKVKNALKLPVHESDSNGTFTKIIPNLEQNDIEVNIDKSYDIESCNNGRNVEKQESENIIDCFTMENHSDCKADLLSHKDMNKLKGISVGDREKSYVEAETKLFLNEKAKSAQECEFCERMIKDNCVTDIAMDDKEQNIETSITNDSNSSTKLPENSNTDFILLEFFQDGVSLCSNDLENRDNNTENTGTDGIDVDIKLLPYKSDKNGKKEQHSLDNYIADADKEDSPLSKNIGHITVAEEDALVVDCREHEHMEDCCSDIEYNSENLVSKTENVVTLEQNVKTHDEQIRKSKENENKHLYENYIKERIDLNECNKVDDVTVIGMNDSECKTNTPDNENKRQMNTHLNSSNMASDSVRKDNERTSDILDKHGDWKKHESKSRAEINGWTICTTKPLCLNDNDKPERSSLLDMTNSVMHENVVGTSEKRIDRVLDYTGRKISCKQSGNETFVNCTENRGCMSMIGPDFIYADMNERTMNRDNGITNTNVNKVCMAKSFSAQSVDNVTGNFKDIGNLVSLTMDQSLQHGNILDDVTNKSTIENQYCDENNNCLIEVYVIDDNEVDGKQMISYADASAEYKVESQRGVDYRTGTALFDAVSDCHNTVNEHGFRSVPYDSHVYADTNDILNHSQGYFEAHDSVVPSYTEQDVDLQMNEDWLDVNSSPYLSRVTDIKYENVPYWDTCLVGESETQNVSSGKNKLQTETISRGSKRRKTRRFIKQTNPIEVENMNVLIPEVKTNDAGVRLTTKSKQRRGKEKGKEKKYDLCTRIDGDFSGRKKLLKKLKLGKFGDRPHVVRVTEQGMIMDVTEEYRQHLPYLYRY